MRFSSVKNMFTEKRYLVRFDGIKKYFITHKAKTKIFKDTKTYLNETMLQNHEQQKNMR